MLSNPVEQHHWLRNFVGEWRVNSECATGPDSPPMKSSGVERVRMLGDLWIVLEGSFDLPHDAPGGGGTVTTLMTLGFDPLKNRYVGTWIGSPMTHLFVYEGELSESTDASGERVGILPLNTVGPSWTDPTKTARYQDVYELHGLDRRVLWSQIMNDDGTGTCFMTAHCQRVK